MKKIMIVDDEENTVELTQIILEANNFEVNSFTNPEKALNELKKNYKPDLILLDIRMPKISGPDFCKILRSDKKLKNIKILFFTASSDRNHSELKKHRVLGYIFKPFDNVKMVKEINKYLEK